MENKKLYTPMQVAERLGISTRMLQYLRRTGRIEGTFIGNTTLYTEEQIRIADLSKAKPGPKMSKKTQTTCGSGVPGSFAIAG
jgi:hypothetical protein